MHEDPRDIIRRIYKENPRALEILLAHSEAVAEKAIGVAWSVPNLEPDLRFIEEAALLHDIGIIRTDATALGCSGGLPYICHGVEGRKILESLGLPDHALVCERHVGIGLSVNDIRANKFPLPEREMLPISVEEKIVCLADKFFSKLGKPQEKSLSDVRASIAGYGQDKVRVFNLMLAEFGLDI